ncbi:hypothetical protein [Paraburkholderia sp.]|nr:hypothetical protein [Paraburkholderia sp.]
MRKAVGQARQKTRGMTNDSFMKAKRERNVQTRFQSFGTLINFGGRDIA